MSLNKHRYLSAVTHFKGISTAIFLATFGLSVLWGADPVQAQSLDVRLDSGISSGISTSKLPGASSHRAMRRRAGAAARAAGSSSSGALLPASSHTAAVTSSPLCSWESPAGIQSQY